MSKQSKFLKSLFEDIDEYIAIVSNKLYIIATTTKDLAVAYSMRYKSLLARKYDIMEDISCLNWNDASFVGPKTLELDASVLRWLPVYQTVTNLYGHDALYWACEPDFCGEPNIGMRYNLDAIRLVHFEQDDQIATETEGYNLCDFFENGVYLGSDQHGIYPVIESISLKQN